jgi:mono/diheme cytochrome c family protein
MSAIARLAIAVIVGLAAGSAGRADEKLRYNRDIRPILAENCFACHGPDSAARKAKLRLDIRDEAVEADAFVPGKPEKSYAIERIFAEDESEVMPPPKSHKQLTAAQKETLRRWVAEGAEYEPHWSLIPPKRPPAPQVKDSSWVRNPIDAFVLAELEKRGLKPAPEADRRTLARRLSLDLTGLPPKPEDVEAFVNDRSPDYYEKYVEKLMASPHWGEHRGRYWLDAARYADTHGIHFDNYREMWSYRDWVINAFNRNLPFDQFTVEQLAGDLLPNPTLDQLIATGFNRCNITTNEGGVIDEEYVVLYARDRTETVSQVWMGLTAGCAVCHDHKFDPLTMRDFYSLSAFFNNTTQAARDGNIPNTPPVIPVPREEDRPRWEALSRQVAAARTKLDARKAAARPDFDRWLSSATVEGLAGKVPSDKLVFHAPLDEGEGKAVKVTVAGKERTVTLDTGFDWSTNRSGRKGFTVRPGESITEEKIGDFEKDQPFAVSAWVSISKRGTTGGLVARMDEANAYRGWDLWLQADRVGMHIVHAWDQDALKVVAKSPLQPGKWYHVTASYDGSGKAAGVRLYIDGEPAAVDVDRDQLRSTIRAKVPLKLGQRHAGQRAQGVALADVRVYARALGDDAAVRLAKTQRAAELLGKEAGKRTEKETDELFSWWLTTEDRPYRDLAAKLADLQKEEAEIKARGTVAHIMQERSGTPEAYVLFRGEYDKRRDKVTADTPTALPPLPPDLPNNRLGLARWLLRDDHPLTARVTVNRFWQELFGTGIVATPGDFGITGELPSHPELLDWLAVEFRESGWDVKRFFRLLVTSNTYRQAAVTTPEKLQADPDNRLLSRGPRFRMDAEMIRDYALAASGLLVPKIGGPSVKPYQPPGVWEAVAMPESNTRIYQQDSGENLYRRSVYTFWKRAAPPASMEVLNAPNRETCTVRRDRTNTPLQALVTLNDVQFVEAARRLAEVCLKAGHDFDSRLDAMARRLLARPLQPEEADVVRSVHCDLLMHYAWRPTAARKLIAFGESKPDPKLDPRELAAWTLVANQLMNLDEVLNK